MEEDAWLARLHGAAMAARPAIERTGEPVILFLSLSDGRRRATVLSARGADLAQAWTRLAARMGPRGGAGAPKWVRLEWVVRSMPSSWAALRASLATVKRNYFRYGIALDGDFARAFLEQELNANAMLYGGNRIAHAALNERNFRIYARRKYGGGADDLDFTDDAPLTLFATGGLFMDEAGGVHRLHAAGPRGGRRRIDRLGADDVRGLIAAGSAYLARQVGADGRFAYGWHPCFDRPIPTYNALRHASTTYAMIEAWELTRDPALAAAIARALGHLAGRLIQPATLADGTAAAFLVEADGEIKLGGNAVAILALARHARATGRTDKLPLMEKLALGIRSMQDAATGAFVHVLRYPDLAVAAPFRTIYYDGEAAFALMRLHALTGDPRWLATVERAFDHFIAAGHWRHHDHWLGYCVDELTKLRPEARYFRFGIRNVADHLDFVRNRITTFPTLLELMMAARAMLERLAALPAHRHLLAEIDLARFEEALHARAHRLLDGHFWPELAMDFARPDRIAGSFFIRHHGFRVRIDDVEHYLSGLVAYHRHIGEEARLGATPAGRRGGTCR